jgi:hypothetical protein
MRRHHLSLRTPASTFMGAGVVASRRMGHPGDRSVAPISKAKKSNVPLPLQGRGCSGWSGQTRRGARVLAAYGDFNQALTRAPWWKSISTGRASWSSTGGKSKDLPERQCAAAVGHDAERKRVE